MSDTSTITSHTGTSHTGGCHCGRVRYEASVDLSSTITCNCSICGKSGTVLTFVPADRFRLLQGEEVLTDYQFNRMIIHHLFCSVCGVRSFARGISPGGGETVAVNVRCLDGVEVEKLQPHHYDGRSA